MSELSKETIIHYVKAMGFDLVGFAKAEELNEEYQHYEEWLQHGYHADMQYMQKNGEKRKNIKELFPLAKTVISVALNYYTPEKHSDDTENGKISRYAWGKDYHLIMWEKLNILINQLKENDPQFEAVSYVDTGPVMDKVWAIKSGIGWQGKHSNIINKEIGSWFFIGTIICNREFEQSDKYPDYCGTCTACIDVCPTNAIVKDYVVDANKCISYQTIENKNEIPAELKGQFDNWLFGCDICQEVCPWNKSFSVVTAIKEFEPVTKEIPLKTAESLTQEEFSTKFKNSPVKRTKLKGVIRNARFLLESK